MQQNVYVLCNRFEMHRDYRRAMAQVEKKIEEKE